MVNQVPEITFNRAANLYEMERCVVCLEDYGLDDRVVEVACGHIYHKKCVEQFKNDKCALCHTPFAVTECLRAGDYQEMYKKLFKKGSEGRSLAQRIETYLGVQQENSSVLLIMVVDALWVTAILGGIVHDNL